MIQFSYMKPTTMHRQCTERADYYLDVYTHHNPIKIVEVQLSFLWWYRFHVDWQFAFRKWFIKSSPDIKEIDKEFQFSMNMNKFNLFIFISLIVSTAWKMRLHRKTPFKTLVNSSRMQNVAVLISIITKSLRRHQMSSAFSDMAQNVLHLKAINFVANWLM